LAELAATGLPAIVLPYPAATNDHQLRNAEVFAAAGACQLLDERQLPGRLDNHLARAVTELAAAPPKRVRMAQAMTRLARPDATRRVARRIVGLLAGRQLSAV
jgi:UDP-N-acetylglucosamine--N-acetylmuramyl-(pentapeptide) pyrophosphoryl-undecaprenol N-acetylglucosamine transferase